jgi:hypothetical protein
MLPTRREASSTRRVREHLRSALAIEEGVMRRTMWFWRCAGLLTLTLATLARAEKADALTIRFETFDLADVTPGEDLREIRYHVTGSSVLVNHGFAIEFGLALYRNLEDPPPAVNADWDVLVLQPDPGIPADGIYDALAVTDNPSLADPFVLTFVWLGAEDPGSQPFTVNEFDDAGNLLAVLEVGVTQPLAQAVPESATFPLIAGGIIALASLRRWRSGRWAR